MGRLPGFDYSRPFFYMVTLKRLPSARKAAPWPELFAEGRMLYLCPWEPQEARLDKATMYKRAHHLVDWALEHTQERLEAWPI